MTENIVTLRYRGIRLAPTRSRGSALAGTVFEKLGGTVRKRLRKRKGSKARGGLRGRDLSTFILLPVCQLRRTLITMRSITLFRGGDVVSTAGAKILTSRSMTDRNEFRTPNGLLIIGLGYIGDRVNG